MASTGGRFATSAGVPLLYAPPSAAAAAAEVAAAAGVPAQT